jgi:PIN domain nuclease of toxin-antitoxin system
MKLLIDTHALLWYVDQDHLLSQEARDAITDPANDILLSTASIWEIAIKCGLKKLTLSLPYRQWMERAVSGLGIVLLPIGVEHADPVVGLASHHRDPFDRMLAAQSLVEKLTLVSNDPIFDQYGVPRIW